MELTADDVCKIIKECKNSGVKKFKCGIIEIDYSPSENDLPYVDENLIPLDPQQDNEKKPSLPKLDEQTKAFFDEVENQNKYYDDPFEYEQALERGE